MTLNYDILRSVSPLTRCQAMLMPLLYCGVDLLELPRM